MKDMRIFRNESNEMWLYQKIEFGSLEFNSFMDVISLYVSM